MSALNVHPVKSTAIRPVTAAELRPWGLADDRNWMVVDGDGVLVSARTDRRLFTVTARTRALDGIGSDLRLTAPGHDDLDLSVPVGDPEPVMLHRRSLTGVDAGPEAAGWLRAVLQRDDVHLVWCADPTARALNPDHSRPGDSTAYADGYPVLLTTTASLDRLNDWMITDAVERGEQPPDPLPMQRFRPNVVLDDVPGPFAEDGWSLVRIGACVLRVAKPCDRCVMTMVDPTTLRTGKEPIRTLARHRLVDGDTLFGQNLIPDTTGTITVGDPVEVLATRA